MNALMDSFAVAIAATWVAAFCAGAALYALVRDRNAVLWAVFGAVLGPVAIALLALAPPARCPECGAPNGGWQPLCAACRATEGPVPAAGVGYGSERAPTAAAPTPLAGWPMAPPSAPAPPPLAWAEPAVRPPAVTIPTFAAQHAEVEGPIRMLATAVYSGGSQPLTIGHRYILAISGDDLEVRGPVERDPNATVFAQPLRTLDGLGMGDRFAISSTRASRQVVSMGFINVIGDTGENLERIVAAERARVVGPVGADR